jgi:hypothetical protein
LNPLVASVGPAGWDASCLCITTLLHRLQNLNQLDLDTDGGDELEDKWQRARTLVHDGDSGGGGEEGEWGEEDGGEGEYGEDDYDSGEGEGYGEGEDRFEGGEGEGEGEDDEGREGYNGDEDMREDMRGEGDDGDGEEDL